MKELANDIAAWLKDYAVKNNRKTFVIGVSGGVDSALVSTLCCRTGISTIGVILPCQSKEVETERGIAHIKWLEQFPNFRGEYIDLTKTFEAFARSVPLVYNDPLAWANTKSRLRMIALYQIATPAQGLVVGTGNKVEDFGVGFCTKYGDSGVDISPISDLTKTEVRKMAHELGVNEQIVTAIPTDGLWNDTRTDESQLGATYEELEWVMKFLEQNNGWPMESTISTMAARQQEVLNVYNKWHNSTRHKFDAIPTFCRKA